LHAVCLFARFCLLLMCTWYGVAMHSTRSVLQFDHASQGHIAICAVGVELHAYHVFVLRRLYSYVVTCHTQGSWQGPPAVHQRLRGGGKPAWTCPACECWRYDKTTSPQAATQQMQMPIRATLWAGCLTAAVRPTLSLVCTTNGHLWVRSLSCCQA
jgi:hypothetical protein